MHGTALIYLTLVTITAFARPENFLHRIREDVESARHARLPPDDSPARGANKFEGKSRARRTLVLLMPMEEEGKENVDDYAKDSTRRSQKTKRCKAPVRTTRLSLPLSKPTFEEGRQEYSGDYVGEQEPRIRLVSLKNPNPVLKDILMSHHFEEDDNLAGQDESARILKAIREHIKNSKGDVHEDRVKGGSKVNGNKYVCYCHEDDHSYSPFERESTRDFPTKQASPPRKEKVDKNNFRKLFDKEDARRKRPNHVNAPDHRLNPQRLPTLYPKIHHVPPYAQKYSSNKISPLLRPPYKSIEDAPYLPLFHHARPQIALPPVYDLPHNNPTRINVPVSQGSFPIVEPKQDGYIVGSAQSILTTEKANAGDSSEEASDNSKKDKSKIPARTFVQTSTPVGSAFLNIDECIKLHGRDVCVISATSAKAFADGTTRINDDDDLGNLARSNDEDGSINDDVHEDSTTHGSTEHASAGYSVQNKVDTTPFGQEFTATIVPECSTPNREGSSGEQDAFGEEGDVESPETVGASLDHSGGSGDKNAVESTEIVGSGHNADRAMERPSFHSTPDSSATKDWDGAITIGSVVPESNTRAGDSVPTGEVTSIIENFTDYVESARITTPANEVPGEEKFGTSEFFETTGKVTNGFVESTPSNVEETASASSFSTTLSSGLESSDKSEERRPYDNGEAIVGAPIFDEEMDENERPINSAANDGAPHTALGKNGPTMLGQGSVDSYEIKEVTNGYFTSKAYDNETHLNNWPTSYDDLFTTGSAFENTNVPQKEISDVNLQSKLDSGATVGTTATNGESEATTSENNVNTLGSAVRADANEGAESDEQSSIEKTHTAFTTSEESTLHNAVGKSRAYTVQEASATTGPNESEEYGATSAIENESNYNTDGISTVEGTTVRIAEAFTENENGILEEAENVTEDPISNGELSVEWPKGSSSTELPQSEDSTVSLKEGQEQLLGVDRNSSSVEETIVGEEEPPSSINDDTGSDNEDTLGNTGDTVPDSLTENTDSVLPEYQDRTEVAEDLTNSDEENVAATGPAIYEDGADESTTEASENQNQDTTNFEDNEEDVEAENSSTEGLPFCDNTLLQNSIKAVINNFTSTDLELDDGVNKEIVGSAGESLLPEVLGIPNLKGILSIPQIEETILSRVKNLLSRISGIPKRKLKSNWATNVIRDNLQHMLSAAPNLHRELPPLTVEEREFKDGEWVTRLVTLAPVESEEEGPATDLKRLQNKIHGLLRNPAINLEAARKPVVQNMIVESVRNTFEPENKTVEEAFNDPEFQQFLDNTWSRFDQMGNKNDENLGETNAPLDAEQTSQADDEDSSSTLRYDNFEKWIDSNIGELFGSNLDTTPAADISEETTTVPSSTSSSETTPALRVTQKTGAASSAEVSDSVTAETQDTSSIDLQHVEETSTADGNDVSPTSTYPAGSTMSTTSTSIKLEEEENFVSTSEPTEVESATEVSRDEFFTETIPTTSENFSEQAYEMSTTDSESSDVVGAPRIHSQDSTTINPAEELLTDETEIDSVNPIPFDVGDVNISDQSSVASGITPTFATSDSESTTGAGNTESTETDGTVVQEAKGSHEKSSTKYYSPNDRILHYIKNHGANDADGGTEEPIDSSATTESTTLISSKERETSDETHVEDSQLQEDEEAKNSSTDIPDENPSDDYIEGISKSSDPAVFATTSAYSAEAEAVGATHQATKSYMTESTKLTEPELFITPTFDVYRPITDSTEDAELPEHTEEAEAEELKSTTPNAKEFSMSSGRMTARENALRSQGAFTTSKNEESSPAEWFEDYTPTNGGLVKTHEVTTEIQKKITKTTKYFGKVRSGVSGKNPGTSAYSNEYGAPITEVFTQHYEDVSENESDDGGKFVGEQRHADVGTEFSTGVTATDKDPTYFGKISLQEKKSDLGALRDLEGSELFYIGDGVKLPLELRKLNDGSYALSISKNVCEHILNRKCPCCVPHGGDIARVVRSKGDQNEAGSIRIGTHEMQKRRGRTISELVKELSGQQASRPFALNRRNTRDLDLSNNLENSSMPVEIFIKRYNLSLDLQNVEDPWNVEKQNSNNVEVKTIKNKRDNVDDDMVENLLSIDNGPEIEESDSGLDSSKNVPESKPTNLYDLTNDGPTDVQNSREDHTENNFKWDEYARIYGYQTNNPILDRVKLITQKQENAKQYRYQRNTDNKANKRTAIMKTVLSWLKGLVLSTDQNASSSR